MQRDIARRPYRIGRIGRNIVMQYVLTLAQYVFPMLTFPYLTRVLTAEAYGTVVFLTATASYFHLLVDFGFNLSATKLIAENRGQPARTGQILAGTLQAKGILVVAACVMMATMAPWVVIIRDNAMLAAIYMANVALTALLPDFLFRGLERMEILTVRFVIARTITTGLTFVAVKASSDLVYVPLLLLLGTAVSVLMTWNEIRRMRIPLQRVAIGDVWRTLRASSVYFMATFATTLYGATNTFVLGMTLPARQIALWGVSYSLIAVAQSAFTPILGSLYPHVAATKDTKLIRVVVMWGTPVVLVLAVGAHVLAGPIINLVAGPGYRDAMPVFRALLPVLVFSFPALLIGHPVLGVFGKVGAITATTSVSGFFHVGALIVLVATNHVTVVAVALCRSLTELVLLCGRVFHLRRIWKTVIAAPVPAPGTCPQPLESAT